MLLRDFQSVPDASVGDLLEFDALFERLTDREQNAVLRKIKHEVTHSRAKGFTVWDVESADERGYRRGLAEGAKRKAS